MTMSKNNSANTAANDAANEIPAQNQLNDFLGDGNEMSNFEEFLFNDFKKMAEEVEIEDVIEEQEEITLEQAVEDLRNDVGGAFDFIFSHYKPRLDRLARRMNDEDLSQELSIVLWRAALSFDATAGAKFNTFFWRCAQNHIGTQKIRRTAQKRGGSKNANNATLKALKEKEKLGLGLSDEEASLLMRLEAEAKPAKTVSLQATYDTKDSSVELGSFIEDTTFKNQYKKVNLDRDLELLGNQLKPNEQKAIQMVIDGFTLEEMGQALGGITAPAVHVMLRRLGKKKNIENQLREILK